jgi:hypothetical protein
MSTIPLMSTPSIADRLYSKSAPHGSDRQRDAFVCACEPLVAEFATAASSA